MMHRTKIVATVGPACGDEEKMTALIEAGVSVFRLNLSHNTHEGHRAYIKRIRAVSARLNRYIAIMGDLQGPKIRLGDMEKPLLVQKGDTVRFSSDVREGCIQVVLPTFVSLLKVGSKIFIDDGMIECDVVDIQADIVTTTVQNRGEISSHKGVHLPDIDVPLSSITEKDIQDIAFLIEEKVDWIALSFVSSEHDIEELKQHIRPHLAAGRVMPRIMAKIERRRALQNFDGILKASDGVMVARGDLGLDIALGEVPIAQKMIVEKARHAGKPVIVATHMLESMRERPKPTRAEISDVAHAVFDHTDAVMLSGETANGAYPLEAVEVMSSIVAKAEHSIFDNIEGAADAPGTVADNLSHALKKMVDEGEIDVIVSEQETLLSTHPETTLFLMCPNETVARQNALRWGVMPLVGNMEKETILGDLRKKGLVQKGNHVAFVEELSTNIEEV